MLTKLYDLSLKADALAFGHNSIVSVLGICLPSFTENGYWSVIYTRDQVDDVIYFLL